MHPIIKNSSAARSAAPATCQPSILATRTGWEMLPHPAAKDGSMGQLKPALMDLVCHHAQAIPMGSILPLNAAARMSTHPNMVQTYSNMTWTSFRASNERHPNITQLSRCAAKQNTTKEQAVGMVSLRNRYECSVKPLLNPRRQQTTMYVPKGHPMKTHR